MRSLLLQRRNKSEMLIERRKLFLNERVFYVIYSVIITKNISNETIAVFYSPIHIVDLSVFTVPRETSSFFISLHFII
jgi:hypothetical protein